MKCFFGHKFGKWKLIKQVNKFDDELHRSCKKCGKIEKYIDITEVCFVSGDKLPYNYKC